MPTNHTNPHVRDALTAFTTRFNLTETQAMEFINETSAAELPGLVNKIKYQADICESVILQLIEDHHFQTLNGALDEVILFLSDNISTIDPHASYFTILRMSKIELKYIRHGFPKEVGDKLNAHSNHIMEDHIRSEIFDELALELAIYANIKRREDALIAERELRENALTLIMAEAELSRTEAENVLKQIPLEEYNSLYHHFSQPRGFYTRYSKLVDKLMDKEGFTYEKARDALADFAYGHSKDSELDLTTYLTYNDLREITPFRAWHFGLLSEKMCNNFRKKYPQNYANQTSAPIFCSPYVNSYLPVSSVAPPSFSLRSFEPRITFPETNFQSSAIFAIGSMCALAFLYLIINLRPARRCGFFKRKNTSSTKKPLPIITTRYQPLP
ncbi:MAG: hypothetical protein V4501_05855 [Pseudomonadota bacterium]